MGPCSEMACNGYISEFKIQDLYLGPRVRFLPVTNTIPSMVLGTRVLKYRVLGPSGYSHKATWNVAVPEWAPSLRRHSKLAAKAKLTSATTEVHTELPRSC